MRKQESAIFLEGIRGGKGAQGAPQGGLKKSTRLRLFRGISALALLALVLQSTGLGTVLAVQAAADATTAVDNSAKAKYALEALDKADATNVGISGNLRIRKFYDDNGNGVRNTSHATDPWLSGWHFVVKDDGGVVVAQGETNGEEGLLIADLPVGDYTVTETLPGGWAVTTGNVTESVTVTQGKTTVIDFGNWRTTGGLEHIFSRETACTQGESAGYAVASGGVGLLGSSSDVIENVTVPGTVVAAYLVWGTYDVDTDPAFRFNGADVVGDEYREANDAVGYIANVTGLVSSGTHSYTVENPTPNDMQGVSLYIVYSSASVDPSKVTLLGGVDTAFWNRPYHPRGPDTKVYSYTFAPVAYDRTAVLKLSVGGGDHTDPDRGDNLWVRTGTGAVPSNLVDQAGAIEHARNILTAHEGPEWDHPSFTVTIPANSTYFAYQIESPEDEDGESFILFASTLDLPLDCPRGELTVHKFVDADGDGNYEGGNAEANALGFRWRDLNEAGWHDMGTTVETSAGAHEVTETQIPGWHFTGWYLPLNGIGQYSCTDPQGTTLPVPVNVIEDQETVVNLCNARDTGELLVHKLFDSDGDGVVDQTDPDGWTWNIANGEQGIPMGESRVLPTMTYTVTEHPILNGYSSSWQCYRGKELIGQGDGPELEVALTTAGAECWFSNVRDLVQVDFDKVVVGGGPATDQDWEFTLEGTGWVFQDGDMAILPTNEQYKVTESSVYDELYTLTDASGICAIVNGQIILSTGEEGGTCVIENTRKTGDITGIKFHDLDADGIRDAGEPGLEGITIELSNGDSTLTQVDGSFMFSDVPTGTYTVTEILPDGWMNTTPISVEVEVMTGEPAYVEFGNTQSGTISGMKWNDLNGDGVRQDGEPGIADWTINLWDDNAGEPGNIIATTQTVGDGSYAFTQLEPGTYWLNEALVDGWIQTSEPEILGPLVLTSGEVLDGNDFGNFQLGSISGAKWNDADGDGVWDANEEGLANWKINLWEDDGGEAGAIVDETLTDADGMYDFTDLGPGTYWLTETLQDGWEQTSSPITLGPIVMTSGLQSTDNNFGNRAASPELAIEKTVNVDTFVNPGATVTYTVVVRNIGQSVALNVMMTDQLPSGFIFVDTGLSTRSFPLGDLEVNESITLTYDVIVRTNQPAGFYDNVATADADNTDPVSDDATVEVRLGSVLGAGGQPTLLLTKSVNTNEARPGQFLTYTLKVSNVGDSIAANVRVTDTLPEGLTFADSGLRERIWTLGSMFTDDTRTITYEVKVADNAASGNYVNVAKAVADNHDEIRASQNVLVKRGQVLGLADTGSGLGDIAAFSLGLLAIISGLVVLYDMRRFSVPLNR